MKKVLCLVFVLAAVGLIASPVFASDQPRQNNCYLDHNCTGGSEGNIPTLEECQFMLKKLNEDTGESNKGSYFDDNGVCTNIDPQGNVVD